MSSVISKIESELNNVFVKKAPPLPEGGKKFIVQWAPIITLIIGVLSLLSALSLWRWASATSGFVNYAKDLCRTYAVDGCSTVSSSRWSVMIWLSIFIIIVQAVLYIAAYSALSAHKKSGWDKLFYASLISVAYAVVSLFSAYSGVGGFVGSLIGAAIGFYLLFQVRNSYLDKKAPIGATVEPKKTEKV